MARHANSFKPPLSLLDAVLPAWEQLEPVVDPAFTPPQGTASSYALNVGDIGILAFAVLPCATIRFEWATPKTASEVPKQKSPYESQRSVSATEPGVYKCRAINPKTGDFVEFECNVQCAAPSPGSSTSPTATGAFVKKLCGANLIKLVPDGDHAGNPDRRAFVLRVPPNAGLAAVEGESLPIEIKDYSFDLKKKRDILGTALRRELVVPPAATLRAGFDVVYEPSFSLTTSGLPCSVEVRHPVVS